MLAKYEPSHRVGPMTAVMIVPAIVAGFGAAWAYQWLIELIPFLYLDALLVIGLGFAVGGATALCLWVGKCRNPIVGALIGVVIAGLAVAASHYFAYQHALAKAPGVSWSQYIDTRVKVGWSIGRRANGAKLKGMFVYLCWAVEAGACVVGGVIAGLTTAAKPFCERCGRWASKVEAEGSTRVSDEGVVARIAAADDIAQVLDVPPMPAVIPASAGAIDLKFVLKSCPTCDEISTVSVERVEHMIDKKGKPETKSKSLHSDILLAAPEAAIVKELVVSFSGTVLANDVA